MVSREGKNKRGEREQREGGRSGAREREANLVGWGGGIVLFAEISGKKTKQNKTN